MGGVSMDDLTIIYLTANEMPDNWIKYQNEVLKEASCGCPIISISRKPIVFGENILDIEPKKSYWNIYMQLLIGAIKSKTKYIAMAEDDVLYTKEHFKEFRPKDNEVSYDRSRWSLFAWEKKPMYCLRNRISNCSLIAPREYIIEALTERKNKWPDGYKRDDYVGEVGRKLIEKNLQVSNRNMVEWYCTNPIIQLNHINGIDERQKTKWKKHGQVKAWDIPYWGKAIDIVQNHYEN
jgi:hypothetical protein